MPRSVGTLCDAAMGGGGARLFFSTSAGVQEQEVAFTPVATCLARDGETGALSAPSY